MGNEVSSRQALSWELRVNWRQIKGNENLNSIRHNIILLLHNFRTHFVSLNQTAIEVNEEYDAYVNIRNYDCIAHNYENVDSSSCSDGLEKVGLTI